MHVPITTGNAPWGTVEVRFLPISAGGWMGWVQTPMVRIMLFMIASTIVSYYWFLRRVLNQLNPSRVVPTRVKTALDTLAEGLIITDDKQQIVLANSAFGKHLGCTTDSIVGQTVNSLPWRDHTGMNVFPEPWSVAYETEDQQLGVIMDLQVDEETRKTFMVNSAPVVDEAGVCQGVLTSLEDVTPLEQKKRELHYTLDQLKKSSDEIRQQNEELQRLATTDPLTDCLNRRAFFEQFEILWKTAERHDHPLSCIMVDIDFFKSVNDNHGHSVGDEVLQGMSNTLRETARVGDLVCRFGGEEFCVLLPHTDIDAADEAAERFRAAIEAMKFTNLSITASLGVSSISLGASEVQQLLDQADKCLYVAKRNGRNQVVRWDNVPDDTEIDDSQISRTQPVQTSGDADESSIPYRAVTALLAALAYRHVETASHCRRVADLTVAVAESLMPLRQCYLVEIAALLHDIGKIGVPDSILLKTEELTNQDWKVMRSHDRIGLEIIRASFASEPLSAIVENRKAFFGGSPDQPGMPVGDEIPLGARILAIADAYDSMTNDSVYRKAMSREAACRELRDRAGLQFDPLLVERFVTIVARQRVVPADVTNVSKETALDIGSQMERLAVALDDQDMAGLRVLADRLKDTASRNGVETISEKASELEESLSSDADLMDVLESAYELVELCRSTQKAYIDSSAKV
jgi:diguanylate cyclase (GGDEF)-like protein/putative nucleotidyltransferase with HDIG domain/PAS domain S-box-containing protein